MSASGQMDLSNSIGLIYDGFAVATALYGITVLQVYNYAQHYRRDHWLLKLTVTIAFLLDTAGSVCMAVALHSYLVENFGNPLDLVTIHPAMSVESVLTVIVTFIVQCFFAHTVWRVDGKRPVLFGIILLTAFCALAIGLAMSSEDLLQKYFAKLGELRFKWLAGLDLGIAALCDIIITFSLCYLFHYRKSGFKPTDNIMDKLLIYTLNRGVLTFILQTLNLVLFVALPNSLLWAPFHLVLSKIYVISFLATLNRRDSLRSAHSADYNTPTELQANVFSISRDTTFFPGRQASGVLTDTSKTATFNRPFDGSTSGIRKSNGSVDAI